MKIYNTLLLAAGLIAISLSCSTKAEEVSAETVTEKDPRVLELSDRQLSNLEVKFISPEEKGIESYIYLNGKVKSLPNLRAAVSSNIEGKVGKVFVLDGSFVKKGDLLLTLVSMELVELQEQYLSARSESDFLAIEFERQKELRANNIGALVDFQTVEAKYKASVSKEKAIKAKLDILGINTSELNDARHAVISNTLSIKSPIDGYVFDLPVTIGMLADRHTVLAEIIDVRELYAEVFVYEKDLDMVEEGQEVEISFVNKSFAGVRGIIYNIDKVIDERTKSVSAHVRFMPPENTLILPDMNIKARILNKHDNDKALIVPLNCILEEEDLHYVFITDSSASEDGRLSLKKCKVILGDKNDKFTEIRFLNPVGDKIYVAQNNIIAIESERKKIHLGVSE